MSNFDRAFACVQNLVYQARVHNEPCDAEDIRDIIADIAWRYDVPAFKLLSAFRAC